MFTYSELEKAAWKMADAHEAFRVYGDSERFYVWKKTTRHFLRIFLEEMRRGTGVELPEKLQTFTHSMEISSPMLYGVVIKLYSAFGENIPHPLNVSQV